MTQNDALFTAAKQYIPGGVNSPVRAFGYVGGTPLFIEKAHSAYVYDKHGNSYVDYVGSWGPMILGHNHPAVIKAVHQAVDKGLSFGAPTEIETILAKKIGEFVPSIQKVRMVNSGTEATMSAIRLARGFTGRAKIIKFTGCYHGHSDSLLVKAGSGALTLGVPSSAGVPASITEHTLLAEFNNLPQVAALFEKYGEDIACIIVEPIPGNMNCILPNKGFLESLRDLCNQYKSLFIFDEVMTGFRVAKGGAQELYDLKPDLTTLGKIIGGGMPVGAFGGREDVMNYLAPLGPVYQAGTLSGNPVAMAAGLATLSQLEEKDFYVRLRNNTECLLSGLGEIAQKHGIPFTYNAVTGMFGIFFTDEKNVNSYEKVMACDTERFKKFFHGMLQEGIYLAPSPFEAGFVSIAHDKDSLEKTLRAADKVMGEL